MKHLSPHFELKLRHLRDLPVNENSSKWEEETLNVRVSPLRRERDVEDVVAIRLQIFSGQIDVGNVVRHHLENKLC